MKNREAGGSGEKRKPTAARPGEKRQMTTRADAPHRSYPRWLSSRPALERSPWLR